MNDLLTPLAEQLMSKHWMLATAESCTGGLIATTCTDLAGSSAWFDRAFVTYSNAAKSHMLGVSSDLISTHGAVSEPVARAMALGAVYRSLADVSVAVTGVAGPGGGSDDKPVGTVWLAWNIQGRVHAEVHFFPGDRQQVRNASARCALTGLITLLSSTT
jgi:nicotinamide-nucleotide amidase